MSLFLRRASARVLVALIPTLTLCASASAQSGFPLPASPAAAPCDPFTGFPLNLNLGLRFDGADGISSRCGMQRLQDGVNTLSNMRAQPNGIATLDNNGLVPLSQIPATVSLTTSVNGNFTAAGSLTGTSVVLSNSGTLNTAASPISTDAYNIGGNSGQSAFVVTNSDATTTLGKERYGLVGAYTGPGTGDWSVPGSSFGVGAFNIKKDWTTTTVPGQTIGINVTARGGYFGSDYNVPKPGWTYNPSADTTGVIINSVQASPYGQNAVLEGVAYFAQGGAFSGAGNVHGMNVQLGTMQQLNADGSVANPGIGVAVSAKAGTLGYAFVANNTARAGSYEYTPGKWSGFARYFVDDGTRTPFDAFRVDADGGIFMSSGNTTTPNKKIRVGAGGNLEVLDTTQANIIMTLTDTGAVKFASGVGFNGVNAVGIQSTPGALPTDGTATNAQMATAINALRTALVTLGLVQ